LSFVQLQPRVYTGSSRRSSDSSSSTDDGREIKVCWNDPQWTCCVGCRSSLWSSRCCIF